MPLPVQQISQSTTAAFSDRSATDTQNIHKLANQRPTRSGASPRALLSWSLGLAIFVLRDNLTNMRS